jgi:hypothetical protein
MGSFCCRFAENCITIEKYSLAKKRPGFRPFFILKEKLSVFLKLFYQAGLLGVPGLHHSIVIMEADLATNLL